MILRTGKAGDNVLDRSVRKRLGNVFRDDRNMVVAEIGGGSIPASVPVAIRCRQAGYLAVIEAVNDLAAKGAQAESARCTILLPEGAQEETLRALEDQVRQACLEESLVITGGHTEVTSAVTRPVVMVSAQGSTMGRSDSVHAAVAAADGQGDDSASTEISGSVHSASDAPWSIVVTGRIAMAGTWLLATEREEELRQRFPVKFLDGAKRMGEQLSVAEAARIIVAAKMDPRGSVLGSRGQQAGAHGGHSEKGSVLPSATQFKEGSAQPGAAPFQPPLMVDAADGGIFAALWKLSIMAGKRLKLHGFDIDLLGLPVFQETIEIADYYGINPYELQSTGCLVTVTREPERLVTCLRESGIHAVTVGTLHKGEDKNLHNGEECRSLDRPVPDAILRILG